MYVIGTAGHVDHGKSTLVKALTGIDPDRLKEEQEREMTIDLGFAWLTLPNGEEVGIVDVPGHERFVKNMLAGVGGIDLAMLIVAADEGVMPQTREHLAILDLLRVKKGVAVITKRDLVDADFLELVTSDVQELLAGTALEGSPIVPVSSMTGEGLDALRSTLAAQLKGTPERKDLGHPRLPVDRSFTMSGFGAVVTGTLIDGTLQAGQEVEIVPGGLRARVRGLQSHRKRLESAGPGRRLAVNLSGVSHEQLGRGQVVTTPGWLAPTDAFDARLWTVNGTDLGVKHGASVLFHAGTFESPARVRLLDADVLEPGESGWVQIKTQVEAPVRKGDLFILRDSRGTLAGGEIVEPDAKRHRRFQEKVLSHLEVLEAGAPKERVLEALSGQEPCQARALVGATGLPWEDAHKALTLLLEEGRAVLLSEGALQQNSVLYSAGGFQQLSDRAASTLAEHHRRYPLRRGMSREELRSRLELPAPVFALAAQALALRGSLKEEGAVLRLPGHSVELDPKARGEAERYLRALSAVPYGPPSDIAVDPEIQGHLLEEGRVVRASTEVVFTTEAFNEMVEKVKDLIQREGPVSIAKARDLLGTSRKYVLAVLEQMDQRRITRRVGDDRVLR